QHRDSPEPQQPRGRPHPLSLSACGGATHDLAGGGHPGCITASSSNKATKPTSVTKQYLRDLESLLQTLQQSQIHYIKCFKPNLEAKPRKFDDNVTLLQLKQSGTLELIPLMKNGWPFRVNYASIMEKLVGKISTSEEEQAGSSSLESGGTDLLQCDRSKTCSFGPELEQDPRLLVEALMSTKLIAELFVSEVVDEGEKVASMQKGDASSCAMSQKQRSRTISCNKNSNDFFKLGISKLFLKSGLLQEKILHAIANADKSTLQRQIKHFVLRKKFRRCVFAVQFCLYCERKLLREIRVRKLLHKLQTMARNLLRIHKWCERIRRKFRQERARKCTRMLRACVKTLLIPLLFRWAKKAKHKVSVRNNCYHWFWLVGFVLRVKLVKRQGCCFQEKLQQIRERIRLKRELELERKQLELEKREAELVLMRGRNRAEVAGEKTTCASASAQHPDQMPPAVVSTAAVAAESSSTVSA
ncbi:unnamed protein product, partial [Amoebophrya sp. A120]